MVGHRSSRWLAVVALALASAPAADAASSCVCGASRPCQHNGGSTCYPVVALASGAEACPGDTTHCSCPCLASHPCQHGDMCVPLQVVFGVDSCPYGSTRCHVAAGTTGDEQLFAPTPAPPAPAPHDYSTNVCRCAGSSPCSNGVGTCIAEEATGLANTKRCPSGSHRCHCDCLDIAMPCQHELLDICMPDFDSHGTRICPAKTVRCDVTAVVPTPAPTPVQCVCGGGKPCQQTTGETTCFAQGHASASDATLTCPENTQLCDCGCGQEMKERPCQYWNVVLEKNFCFGMEWDRARGVMACPRTTATCVAHDAHTGGRTVVDDLHKTAFGHTPVDSSLLDTPVDCVLSGWSSWSACTHECGGGLQKMLPLVKTMAANGGALCPVAKTRPCNEETCDAVDCVIGGWTDWSACSQNCHGGLMRRDPIITRHPNRKGVQCPKPVTKECNKKPCAPDLHCKCDPLARTLDPDAPPPGKGDISCQRVQTAEGSRVKVLHPPSSSYFKCAYRESTGCVCCMCHVRPCEDGTLSGWGQCTKQYFFSNDAGENAGAKCPCPDEGSPCQSTSGACLAKVNGACPAGSAVCAGRLLDVRTRSRDVEASIFLTDSACPQLVVYEMCGSWASDVSGTSPVDEQSSQTSLRL